MKAIYALIILVISCSAFASNNIDGATLEKILQQGTAPLIIDVRTGAEYAESHIPGAVNIPHNGITDNLVWLNSYKNREIILYCRSGKRAGMAAAELNKYGFKRLTLLEGHIIEWKKTGRATHSGEH